MVDHLDTGLEQQEVNEKMALYTQKLDAAGSRIVRDNTSSVPVLDNLSMRQIVDQLQTVEIRWAELDMFGDAHYKIFSDNDRTLICRMSKQMESMVGSMRVEQTEDTRELVVGLGSGDAAGE